MEDAEAIRNEVPGVQYLAAGVQIATQVVAGNQNWFTRIQGTDVDLPLIRAWPTRTGAFFSPQDVSGAAKVAVLGTTVNEQLFGADADPVGQIIRIRNQPFRVIGVMATKGQGMGEDMDDQILAPYTTVQKKLLGIDHVQNITVSAATAEGTSDVADAIAVLLRTRHQIVPGQDDDFIIRTLEEMADIRTQAMGTMTTLLAGIAGVSLIVGGIGIMNIMLVSVTERTREIGLRMAIGAKGRDVLLQFLVEAVALSLLGGGIGIALGFGLAEGMSRWMSWPAKVPPGRRRDGVRLRGRHRRVLRLLSGAEGRAPRSDRRAAVRVSPSLNPCHCRHLGQESRQDLHRRRSRGPRAARRVARRRDRRVPRRDRAVRLRANRR